MNLAYWLNSAWMLSCRRSLHQFERATRDVAGTQQQILRETLSSNVHCDFGRTFRFDRLGSPDDFRATVPIGDYESFAPWIDRIAAGEQNVLTAEAVRLLEPTSGSSGGRKLIPYTDSLRRQFRNGVDPWIGDLFTKRPAVRHGRAYWSVTPAISNQRSPGGLTIGFDEDTEYLGLFGRMAARSTMAIHPSKMRGIRVQDTLRQTMLHLLAVPDLSLISVWSPTFLLSLLQLLNDDTGWLCRELPRRINGSSARRIQRVLESGSTISEKSAVLWPCLSLISCWADGASSGFATRLGHLLPGIEIQPKGLISTEAFVSLPLCAHQTSVLSLQSHFFEFAPATEPTDRTCLAHELSIGKRYGVIVTTGGGLYRYRTGDIVTVEGFYHQCPMVRFVGRAGKVSDLVGEKLTDDFVSTAITNTMQRHRLDPTFACVSPTTDPVPGYCLLLDLLDNPDPSTRDLAETMEHELSKNPYYEHAIRIGQLRPLTVSVSESQGPSHWHAYEARCLGQGVRRGDIKPVALDTHCAG